MKQFLIYVGLFFAFPAQVLMVATGYVIMIDDGSFLAALPLFVGAGFATVAIIDGILYLAKYHN